MKKVSVVIPVYNEEEVIGGCLRSLVKQTYKDLEIVVVDDGSSDTTSLKIRGASKKYLIKYFKQGHKGPGVARNLGEKKAKGEILVFVDADMTFDKNFIKKLVEPITKGKTKGTFSKEEYVSNWENVWAKSWSINEGWMKRRRHPKNYPDEQPVFRAILKSEFDRVEGFEPGGYTDDWTLSRKLGYKAIAAKGAKFYHKNPDNLAEVFGQAKWVGKREYKLGLIGVVFALIRSSLPVSVVIGLIKSVVNVQPAFLIFKVVYDSGIFIGIIEYLITGKGAK